MPAVASWVARPMTAAFRLGAVLSLGMGCWMAAPAPASAQLGWFGQGESSSQDAYDTIASHGFRLAGPLMQSNDVYIADVIDRRQRRQRLIISRNSGRILQRFLVDVSGRSAPYAALPGAAYGSPLPPRTRSDPDFFSRLVRGFGDDGVAPRPPADIDNGDQPDEAVEPRIPSRRAPRIRPSDLEPRVATRRDDAPIASRPLTPEPASPRAPAAPAPAVATPAAPAAAPVDKPQQAAPAQPTRATVVSTDPLRIPGTKEAPKPPAPAKPAPVKPVPSDVPVAPLD